MSRRRFYLLVCAHYGRHDGGRAPETAWCSVCNIDRLVVAQLILRKETP